MKLLGRYWGLLAFAALIAAWLTGNATAGLVIVLSIVSTFYFFFQAPVWCGAITRDGALCRRNASGLLMGCSLRQHKWQKLKMAVIPRGWRELNRGLWASPKEGLVTLAGVASIVSGFGGIVIALVK